jgi:hypothetical protein
MLGCGETRPDGSGRAVNSPATRGARDERIEHHGWLVAARRNGVQTGDAGEIRTILEDFVSTAASTSRSRQ